jgi:hypothetical protein
MLYGAKLNIPHDNAVALILGYFLEMDECGQVNSYAFQYMSLSGHIEN